MTTTIPEPVGLLANSADQLPSNGHEQSVCDRSHPPVSLKRNAAWVLAGNGTYAACQWMQVAVLAHAGTSRDVGRYALAFAIATPIFMLANLQLRSIQATDTARRYTLGHYVALRLVTCFLGLLAVLLIACLYSRSYEIALVTVLVGVFKAVESMADVYQGALQQRERLDCLGRSFSWKGFLVFSAFGLCYACSHKLLLAAAGMAFAQLVCLLSYDIPSAHRIVRGHDRSRRHDSKHGWHRPLWQFKTLRALALTALPLGITMMLISLYANLPRFVLNKYGGTAEVGVFAAITYLSNIGALVVNAIGAAICPRLSKYATEGDARAFKSLLTKVVIVAACMGVAGIAVSALIGPDLLRLLYGAEYARHNNVLFLSMVASAIGYVGSILGYAATSLRRLVSQPWVVGLATVVLFGSALILVPAYGLMGAAISTVLASLTSLAGFAVLVCWRNRA